MFVIIGGGALVVLGVMGLFMPPDLGKWDEYKLWLFSPNPVKNAVGFIMCTGYAFEFIVWYLVFYQLLRILCWSLPFVFAYLAVKMFTL